MPAQGTAELPASGVSASRPLDVGCLNVGVTADELHICIKRLKHGSPGIDGVPAEMIKGRGHLLESCLLLLFNGMLVSHFCLLA